MLVSRSRLLPSRARMLVSRSRLLPSRARMLVSRSRLLPSRARMLVSRSRLLPSRARMLVSRSRLLPSRARMIYCRSYLLYCDAYLHYFNQACTRRLITCSNPITQNSARSMFAQQRSLVDACDFLLAHFQGSFVSGTRQKPDEHRPYICLWLRQNITQSENSLQEVDIGI